jgi:hypothetical protein
MLYIVKLTPPPPPPYWEILYPPVHPHTPAHNSQNLYFLDVPMDVPMDVLNTKSNVNIEHIGMSDLFWPYMWIAVLALESVDTIVGTYLFLHKILFPVFPFYHNLEYGMRIIVSS